MKFLQLKLFALFQPPRGLPAPARRKAVRLPQAPEKSQVCLQSIWSELCVRWFPERADLRAYSVIWSRRPQKRVLASCNVATHCVTVARELNYPECEEWLEPLLYHELCHAVLGHRVSARSGRNRWHDSEFKLLESAHPKIRELDAWIKNRGWQRAVRSDRSRRAAQRRKAHAESTT